VPSIPNGVALCTLHHAAFDRHVIGITPDYIVQVRRDVLDQDDGPMLIHGLQGFHGQPLRLPIREVWRPTAASSRSAMRHSAEWPAETVLLWNQSSSPPASGQRFGPSWYDCEATKGKRCDRNRRAHQV
jgi:hypothetical protein